MSSRYVLVSVKLPAIRLWLYLLLVTSEQIQSRVSEGAEDARIFWIG